MLEIPTCAADPMRLAEESIEKLRREHPPRVVKTSKRKKRKAALVYTVADQTADFGSPQSSLTGSSPRSGAAYITAKLTFQRLSQTGLIGKH